MRKDRLWCLRFTLNGMFGRLFRQTTLLLIRGQVFIYLPLMFAGAGARKYEEDHG